MLKWGGFIYKKKKKGVWKEISKQKAVYKSRLGRK